jgi:hypothetical protein
MTAQAGQYSNFNSQFPSLAAAGGAGQGNGTAAPNVVKTNYGGQTPAQPSVSQAAPAPFDQLPVIHGDWMTAVPNLASLSGGNDTGDYDSSVEYS